MVLLNGDTCSKQMDRCNRISYPLTGDAGSVTVIERCEEENPIYMDVKNDGSRHKALMIPAGAFRMPSSAETLKLREVEEGVIQSLEHIHMDGAAIFNFTMDDVPPQIEEVLSYSGNTRESIEYFSVSSAQPVHPETNGGQDEDSAGKTAEQHCEPLRQLQFGDHPAEHHAQLAANSCNRENIASAFPGSASG